MTTEPAPPCRCCQDGKYEPTGFERGGDPDACFLCDHRPELHGVTVTWSA